ncbi:helix-turn-helix domain-containing protein [Aureispira anguillae]|uniref:AraC family transcriptional regulator n=1 Tax=Aureispira anguillae TaxID=2864201 RepID=A0A915YFD8_9BACT|nr:AraC family transcriptional regulator [Aureispira anguillae]BDS12122.1 AraC family transcriptional regulator [Aureispira anguillae]
MEKVEFIVKKDLEPFVNCIMIGESQATNSHTNIPLYPDGYPGIMFQQTNNGFYLLPKQKKLSELFLYGQTLQPISLDVQGPYRYIVFQLYPFASKYLLNIDPKVLNTDCYDLLTIDSIPVNAYKEQLLHANNLEEQVAIISDLMLALIAANKVSVNDKIQQAIAIILDHNGQIKIREVLDQIYMTERTFERHFNAQIGLNPKQFAKIIQFQSSLHQLSAANFNKLIEVGLDSGFTDQSHFIRTFKKYTGQTPSYYLKQLTARS